MIRSEEETGPSFGIRRRFVVEGKEIETISLSGDDYDPKWGFVRLPFAWLHDTEMLRHWNAQNAPRLHGHVIDLLPYAWGEALREQYADQPEYECMIMATRPVHDRYVNPSGKIFHYSLIPLLIHGGSEGRRLAHCDLGDAVYHPHHDSKLLFRLLLPAPAVEAA